MRGLFITFEGPDGAGKTTQIERLAAALSALGHDVLMTREPGGTRISNHIRALLLDPANTEMTDQAEVLLYAASRAQHVHELILPALRRGRIVLCDRFIDASIAYQAYGLGLDAATVMEINRFASSGLRPHRTYMLDISVEESFKRLIQRSGGGQQLDRIEQKHKEYHQKVRDGFHTLARQEPDRILLIDAERSPDEIAEEIIDDCKRFLKKA